MGEVLRPMAEYLLAGIEIARLSVRFLGREYEDNVTGIVRVKGCGICR